MQLGLYTFASVAADTVSGQVISPEQRLQNLIEEAELADQAGLDVFGVGEHHRPDFAISTPAVVLAAIAARTKNIRLTSAVTVLSSDDPVRVFQGFRRSTSSRMAGPRSWQGAGRSLRAIRCSALT